MQALRDRWRQGQHPGLRRPGSRSRRSSRRTCATIRMRCSNSAAPSSTRPRDRSAAFKPQIAHFAALGAEDALRALHRPHPREPSGRAGDPRRQARRHRQHRRALRDRGLRPLRRRCGHPQSLPRPRLRPAVPGSRRQGRGVLCRTSNPGAGEFQDLDCDGRPLYQRVAEKVARDWNGNGNCLLVVGATWPKELAAGPRAGRRPALPGAGRRRAGRRCRGGGQQWKGRRRHAAW